MVLALAIYCACWIRLLTHVCASELLGLTFLGIPLPMAVVPVIFVLLSACLMSSWLMFSATLDFGIFHI